MSFWEIGPRLIWISKRKQSQINTFRKILPTAVYYCLKLFTLWKWKHLEFVDENLQGWSENFCKLL
jgi:hypothetical protein